MSGDELHLWRAGERQVGAGREESPGHDARSDSPRIAALSWGRLELEDGRVFKDAKLWPGGGREWDWKETGTRHVPGVQPADVEELVERGARVIVLSTGVQRRLRVRRQTLDYLRGRGIETHVRQTEEAASLYNQLRLAHAVGGLFHSTC